MVSKKFFYYKLLGRKTAGAKKTTLGIGAGSTKPRLSVEGKLYEKFGWKNLTLKKVYYSPRRIRYRKSPSRRRR